MELIKNKEKELEYMLRYSVSLFKLLLNNSAEELKKKVQKTYPGGLYEVFAAMVKQDILEGKETKEELEYLELLEKEGKI